MSLRTNDIVYISDDNYCMPTIVSIQSIIDNGCISNSDVCIHVCSFGLSKSNTKAIQSVGNGSIKICIDLFDKGKLRNNINSISQKSHVTPTALIKFELANYFSQIDSILYLDSDVIVNGSLSELLNLDLSDSYLAASSEFYCHMDRIRYTLHRTVSNDFYFNSGVMLLNLKEMRKDSISSALWDYKLNKARTKLMDQESLNAVIGSNCIHLPIKWNFNPRFLTKIHLPEINKVYNTNYCTINELEEDIKIIHYVGKPDKPWIYSTAHMRKYWDLAYRNSGITVPLNLIETTTSIYSIIRSIYSKLTNQGVFGTFCFIIYTIQNKLLK